MRLPTSLRRIVPNRARLGAARARSASWLREGAAPKLVALLAAVVLVAILADISRTEREEPRGYAEFTMFREGCAVDATRRRNVLRCAFIRRGLYRVVFTRSLTDAAPVVSRGSCCPGTVGASTESDSSVIVSIPSAREPVRATIFVP
jgi:hypothetical protein